MNNLKNNKDLKNYGSPFLPLRAKVKRVTKSIEQTVEGVYDHILLVEYITKTRWGLGPNHARIFVYNTKDAELLTSLLDKFVKLEYAFARTPHKRIPALHLKKGSIVEITKQEYLPPNFFQIAGKVTQVVEYGLDLPEEKRWHEFWLVTDDINIHGLKCIAFKEDTKNWIPEEESEVVLELATRRIAEYDRITGKAIPEITTVDGKQLYKLRNAYTVEEVIKVNGSELKREELTPEQQLEETTNQLNEKLLQDKEITEEIQKIAEEEYWKIQKEKQQGKESENIPKEETEQEGIRTEDIPREEIKNNVMEILEKPKRRRKTKKLSEEEFKKLIVENYEKELREEQEEETKEEIKEENPKKKETSQATKELLKTLKIKYEELTAETKKRRYKRVLRLFELKQKNELEKEVDRLKLKQLREKIYWVSKTGWPASEEPNE